MQINRAIFSRGSLHGAKRFSKRTTAVGIISSIRGPGTGLLIRPDEVLTVRADPSTSSGQGRQSLSKRSPTAVALRYLSANGENLILREAGSIAGPQAHPSMRSAYPVLSLSKGQDDPSIPQDERRLPLGWSLWLQTCLRRFGQAKEAKPLASGGLQGARIYAKRTTAVGTVLSSRGRGTGFAGPQAQRPPRGAGSYAKRTTVGAQS